MSCGLVTHVNCETFVLGVGMHFRLPSNVQPDDAKAFRTEFKAAKAGFIMLSEFRSVLVSLSFFFVVKMPLLRQHSDYSAQLSIPV